MYRIKKGIDRSIRLLRNVFCWTPWPDSARKGDAWAALEMVIAAAEQVEVAELSEKACSKLESLIPNPFVEED